MSHAMFCIDLMLSAQATESVCNKRIKCQSQSPWMVELKDKTATLLTAKASTQAEARYVYLYLYGCLYHGKAYVYRYSIYVDNIHKGICLLALRFILRYSWRQTFCIPVLAL